MKDISLDPISRIEGHLGVKVKYDHGEYVDARVEVTMFRGFENLLLGKEPQTAINLAGKICGVCGATHTLVSTEAMEMASGVYPSEKVIAFRNIAYSLADVMYNNLVVSFLFQGIDYSTEILKEKSPKDYERGKGTSCQFKDIHGYNKISDIMDNLYFGKEIYKEAFKLQTNLRDLATLIWLRYPQPLSLRPGTLSIRDESAPQKIKEFLKGDKIIQRLLYIMADLRDFYTGFYKDIEEDFVSYGLLESSDYNADYENMDDWGKKRLFPPAIIRGREVVEDRLSKILLGIRVDVEGRPYENWKQEYTQDELGNELDEKHPWNKETKLGNLLNTNFIPTIKQYYNGQVFMPSTGDLARLYTMRLLRGKVKALGYEWEPRGNNVIERTFARVFTIAFLKEFLEGVEIPQGNTEVIRGQRNYKLAVGAQDAPRGSNGHWVIVDGNKVKKYQIVTPSERNFSPMGGPVERSIIHQRVDDERGIELHPLRIVRSFDPCSACSVHLEYKDKRVMIPV
ncbi:nickel-dependent hydrogenase large subunit [Acidianus sp. RZ1]|uniref:nickel-dependent hydrogenase large subunit n=1 Tax=Acidianus sp. RZ1 TaxID=1540082 RepID=UPI001490AEF5|nr:nickel-dependent hydrogenase large subunit [Acidianus sp. RZ1]NON61572.1 Ni,Fe-hydrogenase I large subunit [Acidianus sp. RZ1]